MFNLLDEESGPVLRDFPESIEGSSGATLACPVPAAVDADAHPGLSEVEALWPAYRRTVGSSVDEGRRDAAIRAIRQLMLISKAGDIGKPATEIQGWILTARRYYERAAISLSDRVLGPHEFEEWFFESTEAGSLIRRCQRVLAESGRPSSDWRYLVPRAYMEAE